MKHKWFARFFTAAFAVSVLMQPGSAVSAVQAQEAPEAVTAESADETSDMEQAGEEKLCYPLILSRIQP